MSNIVKTLQKELNERYNYNIELILVSYRGSYTYGTHNKDSDLDLSCVFFAPPKQVLGLQNAKHKQFTLTINDQEYDVEIFPFRKYCKLAKDANPNILEMLYLPENFRLYVSDIGEKLIEMRSAFLSKKCKHTFGGYAHSQLKRLEVMNKDATTNSKRREKVNEFGYDTKKAYHTIRLLNMGIEALTEHRLNVLRPERQKLKDIRDGLYSRDEIIDMAHRKDDLLQEAYVHSDLQHSADVKRIDEFLMKGLMAYLNRNKERMFLQG